MADTTSDYSIVNPQKKKPNGGKVRKTLLVIVPILLLIGLFIGFAAIGSAKANPKIASTLGNKLLPAYIGAALVMFGLAVWYVFDNPPSWVKYIQSIVSAILIILVFLMVSVISINTLKKPKEKKRSFNTLAVIADYAKLGNVQLEVRTQGEVRPQIEIDLVPEVGGKIVFVSPNFIEGGIFKKGETLLRIEDADFQVAVIRAEAGMAQAEQVLAQEQAEGEVARQDYAELGRGEPSPLALREPQQAQARASLQAAKAELEAAKLNLSRTEVRAPFSGRVREKSSDIGQFVTPGSRLARIFSSDIAVVRLPLSDPELAKLDIPLAYVAKSRTEAPKVDLSAVVAGSERHWEGRIMRTDATFDTTSRALFAIVEVLDPYGKGASEDGVPLAAGLFVDAKIAGKFFGDVITIPRDGLRPENEVYIVDDKGQAEIREVTVLDTSPNRAVLRSGVSSGELVVVSPMERSRVEMTLKVLDINDPNKVLVDPPKPDWMVKQDAEKAKEAEERRNKKKKSRWGRKKKEDKTKTADDASADTETSGEDVGKSNTAKEEN